MVRDDKSRGIEIRKEPSTSGISLVAGGIKIDTLGKPIETHFEIQWGRVYILVDCSGSMAGYKLDQANQGIIDFAKDAIRKEYLIGVIKFDSSATHICEPMRDSAALEKLLKNMISTGSTNMTAAIEMAYENLKKINCSRVIVIATDGQPDNARTSIQTGKLAKDEGIEIITIGTDDADQDFLKKLASRSELGTKVSRDMFAKTISSAHMLLPSPKAVDKFKKSK